MSDDLLGTIMTASVTSAIYENQIIDILNRL